MAGFIGGGRSGAAERRANAYDYVNECIRRRFGGGNIYSVEVEEYDEKISVTSTVVAVENDLNIRKSISELQNIAQKISVASPVVATENKNPLKNIDDVFSLCEMLEEDIPKSGTDKKFLEEILAILKGSDVVSIEIKNIPHHKSKFADKINDIGCELDRINELDSAEKFFEMAAQFGDANAMNNWGCYLIEGRGKTRDAKQGVKWLRKAAEKNNQSAISNIKIFKKTA